MTTIKTSTNATAIMQAVLPRSKTPLDIARESSCILFSVMEPRFLTGTSLVSQITNLANLDAPFTQATPANQATLVSSSLLGRQTLEFNTDKLRHYDFPLAVDNDSAFSMMVVFQPNNFTTNSCLIGNESAVAANRCSMVAQSNGTLRAYVGDAFASVSGVTENNWYAGLMSFDGTDTITAQLLGWTAATATNSVTVTSTDLYLSDESGSFGADDVQIDMAARFNVDIFDAAQADLLADIKLMLAQYYGPAVQGVV